MARVIGKALLAFAVLAALLIIAALVITLREPKFAPLPMPDPNGYDDLVRAGDMAVVPSRYDDLAKLVATNTEALKSARSGLSRECRVPLENTIKSIGRANVTFPSFDRLMGAFRLEGRLAEFGQRPADAAQSYVAITRLGQEIMRGGVVMDAVNGSFVEESGLAPLGPLSARLTAEQCRQISTALEAADAKRETVENIVHQEKIWGRRTFGWRYYMHPIVIAQQKHRASCITVESDRTRKLMITLAARAFELEHGAKPKSINDLVPNYLRTVPKDAFTGKGMAYPP